MLRVPPDRHAGGLGAVPPAAPRIEEKSSGPQKKFGWNWLAIATFRGSNEHGYEFVPPVNAESLLAPQEWKAHRAECQATRFWGDGDGKWVKIVLYIVSPPEFDDGFALTSVKPRRFRCLIHVNALALARDYAICQRLRPWEDSKR